MKDIFIPELIVVLAVVLGLSLIADRSGPRLAGIFSGYPTGSAISLFFFGLQHGATFANMPILLSRIKTLWSYNQSAGSNKMPANLR